MNLSEIGNIPVDFAILQSMLPPIKSVHNKVSDLEKTGTIIRLKKGVYVVSPQTSGQLLSLELIANHLYGPSYISMESALRYYGLIPESVHTTLSITTKHARTFDNSVGRFSYIQCSKEYFPIGIKQVKKENTTFLIATPEKALCDLIIHTPNLNLRFQKDIISFLAEDLRFDMELFKGLNTLIFEECASVCKKKSSIQNIIKILKK